MNNEERKAYLMQYVNPGLSIQIFLNKKLVQEAHEQVRALLFC